MADVVEQDVLQEMKGRRPNKLPEVFVRPALDGKRLPGEVEIHQNGIRYQSPMGSHKIGEHSYAYYVVYTLIHLFPRHSLQQRETPFFPTLRKGATRHRTPSPQVTDHDRQEESPRSLQHRPLIISLTHLPPQDVQFFREASDVQFDETGNRKRKHRYGDEDEIEMEQNERKRRQMLNKEFRMFADKISEAATAFVGYRLHFNIQGWYFCS